MCIYQNDELIFILQRLIAIIYLSFYFWQIYIVKLKKQLLSLGSFYLIRVFVFLLLFDFLM